MRPQIINTQYLRVPVRVWIVSDLIGGFGPVVFWELFGSDLGEKGVALYGLEDFYFIRSFVVRLLLGNIKSWAEVADMALFVLSVSCLKGGSNIVAMTDRLFEVIEVGLFHFYSVSKHIEIGSTQILGYIGMPHIGYLCCSMFVRGLLLVAMTIFGCTKNPCNEACSPCSPCRPLANHRLNLLRRQYLAGHGPVLLFALTVGGVGPEGPHNILGFGDTLGSYLCRSQWRCRCDISFCFWECMGKCGGCGLLSSNDPIHIEICSFDVPDHAIDVDVLLLFVI